MTLHATFQIRGGIVWNGGDIHAHHLKIYHAHSLLILFAILVENRFGRGVLWEIVLSSNLDVFHCWCGHGQYTPYLSERKQLKESNFETSYKYLGAPRFDIDFDAKLA